MKCPICHTDMFLAFLEPEDQRPFTAWICPECDWGRAYPTENTVERLYHCAYCTKEYKHIQTDDHTPLAELICPVCAKALDLELQTHPFDPEDDEIVPLGC